MPSKSRAQHNLMEMALHNRKKARGKLPPISVAKEFVQADKGRKFGRKR